MTGLWATVQLDVRLQARARLYSIGMFVAVCLGLAGRFFFESSMAGPVLAGFCLTGLGGTTFMFGASMVLLEKGEGTLEALRVSPLSSNAYLLSKALTLTAFAGLEALVVYGVAFWGVPCHGLLLAAGLGVLGLMYTGLGLALVAPCDSVTSFLMPGALAVSLLLQLPILHLFDVGPAWVWHLIPSQAPLLLMLGAFRPLAPWQAVYAAATSIVSLALVGAWVRLRFERYVGLGR